MSRTITVKGTGSVSLTPDLTVVTMTLDTVDKNYDRAMERSAALLDGLREALAAVGFDKKDLKTSNFNVCTRYEGRQDSKGNYKEVFVGYACVHGLKLEFDFDTKRLSAALSAIAGCVAEPSLNVRFTVRDRDGAADALLQSAAENARHKAEVLAAASGVKLGELLSVNYSWGELNVYSGTDYAMERKCMPLMTGCAAMDFEPEDIDLNDTATFVWEIA